jgi:hypothetical protein
MAVVLEQDSAGEIVVDEVHFGYVGVVDGGRIDVDGRLPLARLAKRGPGVGPVVRLVSPVRIVAVRR